MSFFFIYIVRSFCVIYVLIDVLVGFFLYIGLSLFLYRLSVVRDVFLSLCIDLFY